MEQPNDTGSRKDLVLYRIESAKEDLKSAKILLNSSWKFKFSGTVTFKSFFDLDGIANLIFSIINKTAQSNITKINP